MAIFSARPIGFTRWPVTTVLIVVYVALFSLLLTVHHSLPAAPTDPTALQQTNLTQSWLDLQHLSSVYHPFNSHANDQVRQWLLLRIQQILQTNNAAFQLVRSDLHAPLRRQSPNVTDPTVFIYDDLLSNSTFTGSAAGTSSTYFEGSNLLVWVKGEADDYPHWRDPHSPNHALVPQPGKHGVLVNAHYDSVSTGFGTTDDGVGVVTLLQLVNHYSKSGNQPKRGLLALFNNGEEDYLNGARVFARHPLSAYPDTFMNLEGAGAGGRAAIFRSTDADVTYAYRSSPHPFGNAASADGFRSGLVRSQTDYIVFDENMGMRGLDVAFIAPRSRYHTSDDSTVNTNRDSVWHMLSAALATTQSLTADADTDFSSREGVDVVFFDMFGSSFAVLPMPSMIGISIALLVVAPLVLVAVAYTLSQNDRWYLLATSLKSDPKDARSPDDEIVVPFGGWAGLFRLPIAGAIAFAVVVALALLVVKVNPYIIYSSPYSTWAMMLCAFVYILWFILRGADYMRPSALQRTHAMVWIYLLSWVILVASTAAANIRGLAGGYPFMIYNAAAFVAVITALLEFSALPKRTAYARSVAYAQVQEDDTSSVRTGLQSRASDRSHRRPRGESPAADPSESTSLLGRDRPSVWRSNRVSHSRHVSDNSVDDDFSVPINPPHGDEQAWSGSLPSWLWIVQFFVLGPINIILLGQLGLFLTSSLPQTLADGSSALVPYMSIAILSGLILLPAAPFIHRIPSRVPNFLLLVFIGCLAFNLVAFPFSEQNRLKVFFEQRVDLDTGANIVTLTGLSQYVQHIIGELPSAAGNAVSCDPRSTSLRQGLKTCKWPGLSPRVVGSSSNSSFAAGHEMSSWLKIDAKRLKGHGRRARFVISGRDTRACRLYFDSPITDFNVTNGAEQDERFQKIPNGGAYEVRLWSREWEYEWEVTTEWKDEHANMTGRAMCLWSDQNTQGAIPALEEVKQYMPGWSVVTKQDDGLVSGFKSFEL